MFNIQKFTAIVDKIDGMLKDVEGLGTVERTELLTGLYVCVQEYIEGEKQEIVDRMEALKKECYTEAWRYAKALPDQTHEEVVDF